jgi:predicted ATPase
MFYLAELHRLNGELRLITDPGAHRLADADFGTALDIAGHQGAQQLFLRAATSRARLWCTLGRQAEARTLLDRARQGIAEGGQLPDVVDAAALIVAAG